MNKFIISKNKRGRKFILIILIALAALILRLYNIDSIPNGLHRDEVATGYTAYSIVQNGKDEHGVPYPLVFESFGDWKRPLNIYLTALFVPFFGLSEITVRLPIALLGSLTVLLVFGIVYRVTGNFFISSVSQLLIALSPWHIFMSRTGLGWNIVGVFLFLLGIYLFLNSNRRPLILVASAISFGLTLFAYASNQIITPLFIVIFIVLFSREIRRNARLYVPAISVFFFFLVSFMIVYYPVFRINSSGSSFYTDEFIYSHNDTLREDHDSAIVSRLVHNKYIASLKQFTENYFEVLSPQFLFFNHQDNPSYSMINMGNFYWPDILLVLMGLFMLPKLPQRYRLVLLALLLLVPLPAALTINPASSTRTLLLVPIFAFLSAFAFYHLIEFVRHRHKIASQALVIVIGLLYFVNVLYFIDEYFVHFPVTRAKHWGFAQQQLAVYLMQNDHKYNEIIIGRPEESFYSYLLFYKQYDPIEFFKNMNWYSTTEDGFRHVKSFDKYTFKGIELEKDSTVSGRLIVDVLNEGDKEKNIPRLVRSFLKRLDSIRLPNGAPIYVLYETIYVDSNSYQE